MSCNVQGISSCSNTTLSFSFTTKQSSGLLLYQVRQLVVISQSKTIASRSSNCFDGQMDGWINSLRHCWFFYHTYRWIILIIDLIRLVIIYRRRARHPTPWWRTWPTSWRWKWARASSSTTSTLGTPHRSDCCRRWTSALRNYWRSPSIFNTIIKLLRHCKNLSWMLWSRNKAFSN